MVGCVKSRVVSAQFKTVLVSQLKIGARLGEPILEDRADQNVLLLAAGAVISSAVLDGLQQRGIVQVKVKAGELARLTGGGEPARAARRSAPVVSAVQHSAANLVFAPAAGQSAWSVDADSFVNRVQRHGAAPVDALKVQELTQRRHESVKQVACLFECLGRGDATEGRVVAGVTRDSLERLAGDLDLFVSLGISPQPDEYPYGHGLQASMLAMSVGAIMGLKESELLELGMGCLVHDAGMLKINPKLLTVTRALKPFEFLEVTKHPTLTFEMIKELPDLSTGARMVAYQIHERWNGSGYPRRRQGKQIHPLARIAGVADVFVALVSPRPHRPGLRPDQAMRRIIEGVPQGLYDPEVVRGLLHTVSLFPLGSFIELTDNRVGRVVRANGEHYAQPVVEAWLPGRHDEPPEIVDLAREKELRIRQTLESLPAAEPLARPPRAEPFTDDHWN